MKFIAEASTNTFRWNVLTKVHRHEGTGFIDYMDHCHQYLFAVLPLLSGA